MTQRLAIVLASCVAGWLGGCHHHDDIDAGDDAAIERADANDHPDSPHGTAPVLAPCTDATVCADGPGVTCLTNVPGGTCTRRCDVDSDCGANGSCVQNICLWSCVSGSGDCVAHAGACLPQSTSSWCVPICYPAGNEPAGYPSCGAGLVCDPYTSTCTTALATGADDGAPCRDSTECRGGACVIEVDFSTNMPTGFLDGMCISYGIVPSERDYEGAALPQGSCPAGSAVTPGFASTSAGDLGVCYPTCATDANCRAGYACTHLEQGGREYANGLCFPLDCSIAPCPTGTTCDMTSDAWLGHPVCGRNP